MSQLFTEVMFQYLTLKGWSFSTKLLLKRFSVQEIITYFLTFAGKFTSVYSMEIWWQSIKTVEGGKHPLIYFLFCRSVVGACCSGCIVSDANSVQVLVIVFF